MIISGQLLPSLISDTHATVGVEQLSASVVTTNGSGAGTEPLVTEIGEGFVAVGKTLSLNVYVYVQGYVVPLQLVNVYVNVLVPPHAGSGEITGAETVSVLPQLSKTVGAVGVVIAERHATVEEPFAGIVTVGALTV